MPGIVISLKQSIIFKVLCIVLSVLVSGLCVGVPVHASSLSDFNYTSVSPTESITSISLIKPIAVYDSYDNVYTLNHSNLDVYSLSSSIDDDNVIVWYEGTVNIQKTFSGFGRDFHSCIVAENTNFRLDFSSSSHSGYTFNVTFLDYSVDCTSDIKCNTFLNNATSSRLYFTENFRIHEENFTTNNITVNFTYHVLIEEINTNVSNLDGFVNSMVSGSWSYGCSPTEYNKSTWCYVSDYSMYEILNTFDTKLYNIWVTENLIYSQLRDSQANNSIADNIQSNAAVAESQANRLYDSFVNDSSSVSSNLDSTSQSYAAAESAAEVAINGAVPSYESDLQQIENFNGTGFFNGQLEAASFWKNLGNYILDSNNLGYISTGLIIVTIVTLFVFLLRL